MPFDACAQKRPEKWSWILIVNSQWMTGDPLCLSFMQVIFLFMVKEFSNILGLRSHFRETIFHNPNLTLVPCVPILTWIIMERNLEGSELRKKETTPPKEDYIMYQRQIALPTRCQSFSTHWQVLWQPVTGAPLAALPVSMSFRGFAETILGFKPLENEKKNSQSLFANYWTKYVQRHGKGCDGIQKWSEKQHFCATDTFINSFPFLTDCNFQENIQFNI